jgi:glycosyltransferase involved in cell wall biosynthesis
MSVKVLHLIGQLERGGTERQLLHLAGALKERGWQQTVVTFDPGREWDGRFDEIGIPVFGVRRRAFKPWRLMELSRIVQREGPALIHSWSGHTNIYARWIPATPVPGRILSFRFIPNVDSYTGKPIVRVPGAGVYAKADCVVSNSHAALACAQRAGVRMRRSEVVDNIVVVKGRARPGADIDAPRIVAAGGLIPVKAYDVLLESLGQLASAGHRFELFLAGDGPEKPRLQRLVDSLGLTSRVTFLGSVDDVPVLFSSAHILVHPSRSEGISNTILEGMAEGLPVVATAVGGIPELLTQGQTGLLVDPDRPDALAAALRRVIESSSLREELGRNGLELVRERCGLARIVSQYERIYESVIGGRSVVEEGGSMELRGIASRKHLFDSKEC